MVLISRPRSLINFPSHFPSLPSIPVPHTFSASRKLFHPTRSRGVARRCLVYTILPLIKSSHPPTACGTTYFLLLLVFLHRALSHLRSSSSLRACILSRAPPLFPHCYSPSSRFICSIIPRYRVRSSSSLSLTLSLSFAHSFLSYALSRGRANSAARERTVNGERGERGTRGGTRTPARLSVSTCSVQFLCVRTAHCSDLFLSSRDEL